MFRTIREQLGARPTEFTAGQGIGAAIQSGGAYFGQVALEKKNAQALADSRAFQVEREEDSQASITEAARLRREQELTDQKTNVDQEQIRYDRGRTDEKSDAEALLGRGSMTPQTLLKDIPKDKRPEGYTGDDADLNTPMDVRYDTNGNLVKVFGQSADWVKDSGGNWGKASAGATGDSSRTEGENKAMVHGRNLEFGLNSIMKIVGVGDGSDGKYDLTSWEATGEAIADKFGTMGNFFKTPQGRLYRAAVTRAAEALFKGESGAAGSDAEARRYQSMFPSPFDDPATVQLKIEMIQVSIESFQWAAGQGFNVKETAEYTRNAAEDAAISRGFNIEKGVMFEQGEYDDSGSAPVITGTPLNASDAQAIRDEDLFSRYPKPNEGN
jgi:hypothetical protein